LRTSSSECRGIDVSRRKATGVKDAQLPHLIDITVLAEHLGVPVRHVRQLVADRRIPFHKWGHLIRFDGAEVAEWLGRHKFPPKDDAMSSGAGTMAALPRNSRRRSGVLRDDKGLTRPSRRA
jgi:excisionase family DNA binding protein